MKKITIGIVAGEVSGDMLAAKLILALKNLIPNASFIGVPGPEMLKVGCEPLFTIDRLAVMGIVDVLAKLPELFSLHKKLFNYFKKNPPDVLIGIDAPDFTLPLELKLKKLGIPTVHYNSPTVWAWRQSRLKKIAKSTDLMLTLFPFEAIFYEKHQMPVKFIGHSLADDVPLQIEKNLARDAFKLKLTDEVIAILPGSRASEIKHLAVPFIQTAQWCLKHKPALKFITPMVNKERREQFEAILKEQAPTLPIKIVTGMAQETLAAADIALVASGTATLEAMLLKKPMVVAYRFALLNYWIAKLLVKTRHFALPNLLADKNLVPEFFQHAVTSENLGRALLDWFEQPEKTQAVIKEFDFLHRELRRDAANQAAHAILKLISF